MNITGLTFKLYLYAPQAAILWAQISLLQNDDATLGNHLLFSKNTDSANKMAARATKLTISFVFG